MAIILLLSIVGILLIFLEFFLPGAVLAVIGTLALLVSLGLFFTQYPALWGIVYLLVLLPTVFITCKLVLCKLNFCGFGYVKAPGLNDRKASCIELIQRALRSLNRGSFHVSPNCKN